MILVDKDVLMQARFNLARLVSEIQQHSQDYHYVTKASVVDAAEDAMRQLERVMESPQVEPSGYYMVYACEHLRDALEEYAKCFRSMEAALEFINRDRFAQDNHTFRLFELGKEIPLAQEEVEEPQPAKKTTVWRVK